MDSVCVRHQQRGALCPVVHAGAPFTAFPRGHPCCQTGSLLKTLTTDFTILWRTVISFRSRGAWSEGDGRGWEGCLR